MNKKNILIIGGGFGGVACALSLARHKDTSLKITLVSDKPHFEYTPTLYRIVTGHSPLEVCIPLKEIFSGKNITCITDTITNIDLAGKKVFGSSGNFYQYDYIVLALGSQNTYFDLPGLAAFSFSFKSIVEASRLQRHIHKLFEQYETSHGNTNTEMHFIVVGAGASGVELAGELAGYTATLAKKHNVPKSLIVIDLIEASSRILPSFSEDVALKIKKRLHKLGVNIFTSRPILKEEVEKIYLKGLSMKSDTIIWTAGIKSNELYLKTSGFTFSNKEKVVVDEYLRSNNFKYAFVVGDGAATPYSGTAQTAIREGKVAAQNIINTLRDKMLAGYKPKRPYYSLPVGPNWAATLIGPLTIYGKIGWLLRKLADLRYFTSILSFKKVLVVFQNNKTLCNNCEICATLQTVQT